MALDIPLPRQVLTHAHWTLGRSKMSKSTGNVVNPFFAIERFGIDTMRYYLIYEGGIKDDAAYENSYIIERYLKGLQGGLGNLLSRVVRGKRWNVRTAVEYGKIVKDNSLAQSRHTRLRALPIEVSSMFKDLDPGAALRHIMNTIFKVIKILLTASSSCYVQILTGTIDEQLHAGCRPLEYRGRGRPQRCYISTRGISAHLWHIAATVYAFEDATAA